MKIRALGAIAVTCGLWLASWIFAPAALALTQVPLSEISYHDCPEELARGVVTSDGSGRAANCFIVTGKAENKSGKTVYDADIYGRIYDADRNPVIENRTRLGSVDEIPPGTSTFAIRISVPTNMPTPLQLEQFKASGFSAKVRR
ncbi:MAG: hypothetical protein KME17_23125 [Cyanosarcina radialis HA8281-LM2]|jgi:hypothetical protein|nr:hypothetical protein [Cyanosarcina radialis HA8281-LM2]